MRTMIAVLFTGAVGLSSMSLSSAALAQPRSPSPKPPPGVPITTITSPGGRAPWSQPWQYDSGSNDRRPELPYYQQGGGQQTGGPARNLIPDDGLYLFPH